jgi:DNA-binding CsgD family transcriptional regulator
MAARHLPAFRGRISERQVLDRLLDTARSGESAVLAISGEAGVGKTSLLRYCARQAAGFRVLQIAGVESEMELAYAGLHQLCTPDVAHLDAIPSPQRDALGVALGLSPGDAPDRFLVALATLSLLVEIAAERPLLCLVDDAQWLDRASAMVLGFVARRLLGESVAMLFAVRQPTEDHQLVGLPELRIGGLADADAKALLASAVAGRLDDRVRDRLVAETRGNPLALLELTRDTTAGELARGFLPPGPGGLSHQIEDRYQRRLAALPEATQRLLLLAAADPTGDATLLWRAAQELDITPDAAGAAEADQLLSVGARVQFRHPLVRSAVYRVAGPHDRRAAHLALAEATDPQVDPDRRAWHRAAAAPGPDEGVAAELERCAGRAEARGGLAAAAALLQRAVALTPEPARQADRALAAAQAHLRAGDFDAALAQLPAAEAGAADDLQRARLDLLRGQIAFASGVGSEAPPLLLKAAERLESLDVALARETYLDAWGAALFAGRLAGSGTLLEVSRAARSAPAPPRAPRPSDVLLDGLAALVTDGRTEAASVLRRSADAFAADDTPGPEIFGSGWLMTVPCNVLWDDETWHAINRRQLRLVRDAGALARLPIDLTASAMLHAQWGDFEGAAAAIAEAETVTQATHTRMAPYGAMLLAALAGRDGEATTLIDAAMKAATAGGQGIGVQYGRWATAILNNGLGRYEQALAAARDATEELPELFLAARALPELIEASTRTDQIELGVTALERLEQVTATARTDWALGVAARSRALLADGDAAEGSYREAVDRLRRTKLRPELARAHLVYGEWLRRHNRRSDAREQLRAAHDLFDAIGMEAFGERARRELLATGETVRKRRDDTRTDLTPQEKHIARLARDGRTNSEIGAELYISARTVEWHLRKVFTKLGISSRKGLRDALPPRRRDARPA